MQQRIGLFGGSFNPVHAGHLVMAQDAFERFGLHRVLFIPAASPPHKSGGALAEASHRVEMLRLAIGDDPRFEVDEEEVSRGGVSYSIDTVKRLRARHPDARFHFIIGGDTLLELHTWRSVEELLGLCEFVTVARPGYDIAGLTSERLRLPDPWPERLRANVTTGHLIEVSSTDIRQRVLRGQGIRYLVPEAVERYIRAQGLYSSQEAQP